MQNRRAHLRFDVVAEDREFGVAEAFGPIFGRGDEDRDGVDEGATGFDDLFHVPFGGHLRADRQETDNHVGLGFFEQFNDIGGGTGRFDDDLREIFAEAVVGHAAYHRHV